MNTITVTTFKAEATFGLEKGYSKELISLCDFKTALFKAQQKIYKDHNIVLSTKMVLCEIVCLGQEEPSVTLEWIQYPKFIVPIQDLKRAIVKLVKELMLELQQNRVVILFPEETICLEQEDKINPAIKL
jgi:hypothetical protein